MAICEVEVDNVDPEDVEMSHIEVDDDDGDDGSDEDESGSDGDNDDNASSEDEDNDTSDEEDDTSDGDNNADVREDLEGILGGQHANLLASAGLSIGGLSRLNNANQFRPLLAALKQYDNQTQQLVALQELTELLSISTEDSLVGLNFGELGQSLVNLLKGADGDYGELTGFIEGNADIMLLACRCLSNLLEALPLAGGLLARLGAIDVLCSKLLEIEYIDLAEQALTTLMQMSKEFPAKVCEAGGLSACLMFLDFFATGTQRTALSCAANCAQGVTEDRFSQAKDAAQVLGRTLFYSDQKCAEYSCRALLSLAYAFRTSPDLVCQLVPPSLLGSIVESVSPDRATTTSAPPALLLRILAVVTQGSPERAAQAMDADILVVLERIVKRQLIGSTSNLGPVELRDLNTRAPMRQESVVQAPDQAMEALGLLVALLPPLPLTADSLAQHEALVADSDSTTLSATTEDSQLLSLSAVLSRPHVIQQLQYTLVPTLVAAFHSTMSVRIRHRVLLAVLSAVLALNAKQLLETLKDAKLPTFVASAISSTEPPLLSAISLLVARVVLDRLPGVFTRGFIREGVAEGLAELASNARAALLKAESAQDGPAESDSSASVDNDTDTTSPTDSTSLAQALVVVNAHAQKPLWQAPSQNSSSSAVGSDTHDLCELVVCQAQLLHSRLVDTDASKPGDGSDGSVLGRLRRLSQQLGSKSVSTAAMRVHAKDLSELLVSADGVTCYELAQSGLVGALASVLRCQLGLACSETKCDDSAGILIASLLDRRTAIQVDATTSSAYEVLIQRLQEALSLAESLRINETYRSASGEASTPANMLTRQIRFSVVPASEECMVALAATASTSQAAKEASATMDRVRQSFRTITVSVHAVAPFSVIEAYLRPRVALFVGKRPRHSPQRSAQGAPRIVADESMQDEGNAQRRPQQAQLDILPATAVASGSRHDMRRGGAGQAGKQHLRMLQMIAQSGGAGQAGKQHLRMLQMIAQSSGIDLHAAGLLGDHELSDDDDDDDSNHEALSVNAQAKSRAEKHGKDEGDEGLAGTEDLADSSASTTSTAEDWRLVLKLMAGGTERTVDASENIFHAIHKACQSSEAPRDANPWTQTFQLQFYVKFGDILQPQPPLSPSSTPPGTPAHDGTDAGQELSAVLGTHSAAIIDVIKLLYDRQSQAQQLTSGPQAIFSFDNSAAALAAQASIGKHGADGLPTEIFVNRKLAAKVARQLDDPLMVVCSALPSWCHMLIRHAPFLISFDARVAYLQATSFGYSRNISRWQIIAQREARSGGRPVPDTQVPLGRMQRQKVRISRNRMLESALKVLELYGTVKSILEVEYFDEVGTGLGPTLEFYSTVSRCLQERSLGLWRETRVSELATSSHKENMLADAQPEYVDTPHGLFPRPATPADLGASASKSDATAGTSCLQMFKFVGHFIAKGLIDGRILDLPLHEEFWAAVQRSTSGARQDDCEFAWSWSQLEAVDQHLASSLCYIYQFVRAKDEIYARKDLSMEQMQAAAEAIRDPKTLVSVSDLALDFTLPGHPEIELRAGGADIPVTINNVHAYVDLVARWILDIGIRAQAEAFCTGFDKVFPCRDLLIFTPAELCRIVGPSSESEDWSSATLQSAIKAEHGFTLASPAVQMFLGFMESLDWLGRRSFLRFVTGAPRLPLGGFRALYPPLTLVQKMSEAPLTSDDYLPSVMTCANFIKLPNYSSLEVLKRRWGHAVAEGQQSFHLS
ncbi:Ubiquitin fusion degradation protein 4 [Coemansia sp. BCRC 34301]|nr:Ubiquitin fusion degradation protein 4 [Coemansia sp. BCRC 34301]